MSYYPQSTGERSYASSGGPSVYGVTVTASGSANTKGSYAQITASTGFASNVFHSGWPSASTAAVAFLVDVATGAAASETVIVPNLWVSAAGSSLAMGAFEPMPLAIAASTRVSARCQCSGGGGATVTFYTMLISTGSTPGVSSYVNYGANTGSTSVLQLDPGGSANTKGAYGQLTSSSSAITQALLLMGGVGNNSAPSTFAWAIDVATGAGGAEVVLVPDVVMRQPTTAVNALTPNSRFVLTYIAASTRIAARAACTGTDATDRLMSVALLAGTAPTEDSGTTAVLSGPTMAMVAPSMIGM